MTRVASWRGGLVLAAALIGAPASGADAGAASTTLIVKGAVAQSTTYLPATLQSMPQVELPLHAPDGAPRIYRGVLLRDLLLAAMPIEAGRFDLRQTLVVARATDGYLAIFSWEELVDTPVGDGVLVATSRDGQPLADSEGAFTLLSTVDRRSGPRHVRWLESIELRRVVP